jgi:aminoglycoside N3'-acetyltransferase
MQPSSPVIDRAEIVGQLRALGVPAGVPLMLHASLRRIGSIEGGADTLLDALCECLGPRGTLVMPLGSNDDEPFDALRSPAERDIGALAELFRQRAGTLVSDHPAARFGAFGARAMEILEPLPLHDYYGEGSALQRFTELDGRVLRLGADPDTVTLTHWAEYLAVVPHKRRVRRRYVRADSGELWVEGLDDCEGIVEWPHGDYFTQILLDFLAAGHARVGSVGGCTAELFEARPFVEFAVRWMETKLRDGRPAS